MDGQKKAETLGYLPLPESAAALAEKGLDRAGHYMFGGVVEAHLFRSEGSGTFANASEGEKDECPLFSPFFPKSGIKRKVVLRED